MTRETGRKPPVFTIGHSTRSIDEFAALLQEYDVEELVDVRRFPASRRHPHFNRPNLAEALARLDIRYRHDERLGGRRPAMRESRNAGLTNEGFRGYADYLATDEAREALRQFDAASSEARVAMMCAEAVPWRCHRNLISDWLTAHGRAVVHILGAGKTKAHQLNDLGVIGEDGTLTYPDRQTDLFG